MGQFSFLRLENSKELLMSACKNNEVDTLVQNNRLELGRRNVHSSVTRQRQVTESQREESQVGI